MNNQEIIEVIVKLIEENPNNYELGEKVRKLMNEIEIVNTK